MGDIFHALKSAWVHGAQMCGHFADTISQRERRRPSKINSLCFILLSVVILISVQWISFAVIKGTSFDEVIPTTESAERFLKKNEVPFKCPTGNLTPTCPENYLVRSKTGESSGEACPEHFRWIHEDLRPWKSSGITRDMVESAKDDADFRLVVVKGKVYVEKYKKVYETRDVFTIWGILQLLRLYPGKLRDSDLMFHCDDAPVIQKSDYQGPNATSPPPLFHYCEDDLTIAIVFPDWSFWGWPEINIKPWVSLKKEIEEGNKKSKWMEREPYAYWKGNILNGEARENLSRCNATDKQDWNAQIYHVDWQPVYYRGDKATNLASQCTHRYKIYVEGFTWSVSEKYILACDSVSLFVKPHYYDSFTRSLLPLIHYWPLNEKDLCRSIKFAVDWGNKHTEKAQEIGRAGSKFIIEELKMNFVYDYMFHLLKGYAKILKYKPTVPPGAVELCSEAMACTGEHEKEKMWKIESMVMSPADTGPCMMLPPYDPPALQAFLGRKESLIKRVEIWEESGNTGGEIF